MAPTRARMTVWLPNDIWRLIDDGLLLNEKWHLLGVCRDTKAAVHNNVMT